MSLSMDGLASYYMNSASNASNASSIEKKVGNKDLSNASDDGLMDVCKQFEAYFVEQMFKAMEATVPESESSDAGMTTMKDYYKEQIIQQYASDATQGDGFGLAQTLYEQMKRNYNV